MAYCTASDICTALNIATEDDDAQIERLIDTVGARLEKMYNLPAGGFAVSANSTRYYDECAVEDGTLRLDMPCLSVTTLVDAGGVTIPTNAYRLYPLNGTRKWSIILLPSYGFAWSWAQDGLIAVTGKFGWSTAITSDVKEAVIMYAAWLFKRYQAALQDAAANQELGQLIYSEAVPKQVLALLPPKNGKAML